MLDIREIYRAWKAANNPTPEQDALAKKRFALCLTCDYKDDYIVGGKLISSVCKGCGCPLRKKIFTDKMGTCPKHLWDKVE